MYVIGGYDGQSRLSTVESLDLVEEKAAWQAVAPMHHRRGLAGVCVYQGARFTRVHCETTPILGVTSIDVVFGARSCWFSDMIYVSGGFDGTTRHTSMERYDPTIDRWSLLNHMSVGREGAGLVVAGDMIYCIGGYDGVNLLSSVEKYDPNTGSWTSVKSMTTKRSGENSRMCSGSQGRRRTTASGHVTREAGGGGQGLRRNICELGRLRGQRPP